jgi:hypothetical protein
MWTERGGPAGRDTLVAPRLRKQTGTPNYAAQLGGTIAFDWCEEGLVVTLRMSKDRLAD